MNTKKLFNNLYTLVTTPFQGEIKRWGLVALPVVLLAACSNTNPEAEKGFVLNGKLSNSHGETVYLELLGPRGVTGVDTVVLNEKGEFKMDPVITEIGFYRLKISDKSTATLILDANQKVNITGDAVDLNNTYSVEGSPDSKLFLEVNKASAKNYKQRDSIQARLQSLITPQTDSLTAYATQKSLEKPYFETVAQHNNFLKNFIEKNLTSIASLAAIQQLDAEDFFDTYVKLDEKLFAKYPNSVYVKSFHQDIDSKKKLATGSIPPDITMNTVDEKPLSLSSLKGKVVLIDFWASWCGPCRAENPNVVKAYNKFKSKGFDIFSVSLDNSLDKWKQAIQKDNLTWTSHVSDFKGWQSPVVQQYNFKGIPYNVLLDKEGKIIAKNLRGEALEKKLAEVLK